MNKFGRSAFNILALLLFISMSVWAYMDTYAEKPASSSSDVDKILVRPEDIHGGPSKYEIPQYLDKDAASTDIAQNITGIIVNPFRNSRELKSILTSVVKYALEDATLGQPLGVKIEL